MNIKNIKDDKKGMSLYQTKDFSTIKINFLFFLPKYDKVTIIKTRLLSEYLIKTNEKYKKYKDIRDKLKEFYDMKIHINQKSIGNENFFSFSLDILDPRTIDENYLCDALSFAHTILFNPNFNKNNLDKKIFEDIKKDIINKENIKISNPSVINERLLYSNMIPESNLSNNLFTDIDEYKNIVKSIGDKDIVDLYNEILEKHFFKGYAFGNITNDEYKKLRELFPFKSNNRKPKYFEDIIISNNFKEVVNKNLKQSNLYVVYKIKNYDLSKYHLNKTLDFVFNTMNGFCLKVLRKELGLVYSSYAIFFNFYGFFYIRADISKENEEICLKAIDDIINRLKQPKMIEELLTYSIERQNQNDFVSEETVEDNINDLENYVYEKFPSRESIHELVNKITIDDIINYVNNFEKVYTYIYKGDKDEK